MDLVIGLKQEQRLTAIDLSLRSTGRTSEWRQLFAPAAPEQWEMILASNRDGGEGSSQSHRHLMK